MRSVSKGRGLDWRGYGCMQGVGLTRQIADFPIALGEISILRKDR